MQTKRDVSVGRLLLAGGLLAFMLCAGVPSLAESPVGEWTIVTDAGGQVTESTLTIMEKDGELSGTIESDLGTLDIADPAFEDGVLTFDITIDAQGQLLELAFEGKIDGNVMDVSWASEFGDFPGEGSRGPGATPVGEWKIVTDAGGQVIESTLTISEKDGVISGTIDGDAGSQEIGEPSFDGNVLTFDITIDAEGQTLELAFSGTVDGDSMDITWGSDFGEFPGSGTRGGASAAGEWALVGDFGGQIIESTMTISEKDGEIMGSIATDTDTLELTSPTFEGDVLEFEITVDAEGQMLDMPFTGKIDGDTLEGTFATDFGDFQVTGTRK